MARKRTAGRAIVRPALPEDAAALARVHVAAWQVAYRGIMPDHLLDSLSVPNTQARWEQKLAGEEQLTLVCQLDTDPAGTGRSEVVGFAGLGPNRDDDTGEETGEVYAIYVHPDQWGHGLGRALWTQAVEVLRAGGYRSLTVWVLQANDQARGFYKHMGCTLDPGVTKVLDRQGTQLAVVRYRRAL